MPHALDFGTDVLKFHCQGHFVSYRTKREHNCKLQIAVDAESYDQFPDRLSGPMSRGQAATLRTLSVEAYQPKLFEKNLTREEADRRIEALRQEIALANSF
jgi:hypothetical protein